MSHDFGAAMRCGRSRRSSSGARVTSTSFTVIASVCLAACSASRPVDAPEREHRLATTDRNEATDDDEVGEEAPAASDPDDASGVVVVEGVLPAPAVWVEAGHHEGCAVAWLNDADRVTWTTTGRTLLAREPGEPLARRREESFRRHPRGPSVRCEVTARGRLSCGYHRCMDPAILVGTQPPMECRSEHPVYASADVSDVQRTEEFTPGRPWWLDGPVPPMERLRNPADHFACVRVERRVRCYPVRRDDRDPSPVHAPELDAIDDIVDLAGAGSTACAVRSEGSVICWGAPLSRDPTLDPETSPAAESPSWWTPRRIDGLPPRVVHVSVGSTRACAPTDDGRIFCWGDVACMAGPG